MTCLLALGASCGRLGYEYSGDDAGAGGGGDDFLTEGGAAWAASSGSEGDDGALAIAIDGLGAMYVTGYFGITLEHGDTTLVSQGQKDVMLLSYDRAGAARWALSFGDAQADSGNAVAVDGANNVYVAGSFSGVADFGGGAHTSRGRSDAFVASYTSDGMFRWAASFGGAQDDVAAGIAVSDLQVVVTGEFRDTIDFGGPALTAVGTGSNVFVASLVPSSGKHRWSSRFGEASSGGTSVAIGPDDGVHVTGAFSQSIDFGGGPLTAAGTRSDAFVAALSDTGQHRWSLRAGDTSGARGSDIATDGSGNVYWTGEFAGTVDLGGGPLDAIDNADAFVASFRADGTYHWSATIAGSAGVNGNAVAASTTRLYVAGHFFGIGALEANGDIYTNSATTADLYVTQLSASDGTLYSAAHFRTGSHDILLGLDARGGAFAIAGMSMGSGLDFGTGVLPRAGSHEMYVAVFPE